MTKKRQANKRWGRVAARPSEYLIQIRRGRVVRHGPGLSVFLWPGDTCTILPTSIQRVTFVADQITAEKVGVAVTGVAVFRIADPLLAFRMLDFDEDGAGEGESNAGVEHLAGILREMFIGAARRLVANMSIADCLTRRKEAIALELMEEIRPVVSGKGRPQDSTHQGWGVVIDTIEIQDVRILSERVFSHLQAPFRASLELKARTSEVQRDQQIHQQEVAAEQEALEVDQELCRLRSQAEEQSRLQALAKDERLQRAQIETEGRTRQTRLEADLEEHRRRTELSDVEHQLKQHEAGLSAQLAEQQAEQQASLERGRAEARLALQVLEQQAEAAAVKQQVELERLQGELETWLKRQLRQAENLFSDERIRYELVTRSVPAIAQVFAKTLGQVNLTQIHSSADGEGRGPGLTEVLAQLLAVARGAGLDLGQVLGPAKPEDDQQQQDLD